MRKLIYILFLFAGIAHSQSLIDMQLLAYQQANGGCIDVAGDVFPTGNAASNCTNEANSIGTWYIHNNALVAAISSDEPDYNYAISIKTDNLANGYSRGAIDIAVANSTTYTVTVTYKVPVADTGSAGTVEPRLVFWSGVTSSPSILLDTDGDIHTATFSITTNSTSVTARFYNAYAPPVDSSDVELIIYNVTISP